MNVRSGISRKKAGFTLIEIMVAVTIFAIVMVTAIGSVLSITNSNRKAQTLNSVISNLNFAVDSMVRDVRTGFQYNCGSTSLPSSGSQDCSGGSSLSLISSSGQYLRYYLLKRTYMIRTI
jgi:prepilin-type N-terminal cleavage/methylation domain-containing protein